MKDGPERQQGDSVDEQPETPRYATKGGKVLTDDDIAALAAEAEQGYDPGQMRPRPAPDGGY